MEKKLKMERIKVLSIIFVIMAVIYMAATIAKKTP